MPETSLEAFYVGGTLGVHADIRKKPLFSVKVAAPVTEAQLDEELRSHGYTRPADGPWISWEGGYLAPVVTR